jgi:hypothetical protein
MIDPENPPNIFDNSKNELEEFLMFAIAVAGKNAKWTATGLDLFIQMLPQRQHERASGELASPLVRIAYWLTDNCFHLPCSATGWGGGHDRKEQIKMLGQVVKSAGLGCYNQRARSFLELSEATGRYENKLDITRCNVGELEKIFGIGKKTSRFFLAYTRPHTTIYAILDTHILNWMAEQGHAVPKQTPQGKQYDFVEKKFIWEARQRRVTPLELDRFIWITRRRQ